MDSDAKVTAGPRVPLRALVIVITSGAALGLSFLTVSHLLGPLSGVSYVAISTGLCLAPALVLRAVRRRVSLLAVVCVVSTTIFSLATVYGLHCRYFLTGRPPSAPVLVAVFASGLGWIVAAIGLMALVIVPARWMTRHGLRVHLLLSIPVAFRWVALILLPILFIWLAPPFFLFVLAVPIVSVMLELTGSSLLSGVMRLSRQATSPTVQRALGDLARRTGDRLSEVIHLGPQWPPICQVRLQLAGSVTLVVSDQALARFSDAALSAVLAHECAHVRLKHLQTRIAVDAIFATGVVAGLLPVSLLLAAIHRPELYLAVVALYLFAAASVRHLLNMALSRRFERAADAFAAQTAGKSAVVEALNATAGETHPKFSRPSRLTTGRKYVAWHWTGRPHETSTCVVAPMDVACAGRACRV